MVELNMTVRELIEKLKGLDADAMVIMSRDSEGNGFSPISKYVEASHYTAFNDCSGECHHPDDAPDYPEAKPCICLWPTQ